MAEERAEGAERTEPAGVAGTTDPAGEEWLDSEKARGDEERAEAAIGGGGEAGWAARSLPRAGTALMSLIRHLPTGKLLF